MDVSWRRFEIIAASNQRIDNTSRAGQSISTISKSITDRFGECHYLAALTTIWCLQSSTANSKFYATYDQAFLLFDFWIKSNWTVDRTFIIRWNWLRMRCSILSIYLINTINNGNKSRQYYPSDITLHYLLLLLCSVSCNKLTYWKYHNMIASKLFFIIPYR